MIGNLGCKNAYLKILALRKVHVSIISRKLCCFLANYNAILQNNRTFKKYNTQEKFIFWKLAILLIWCEIIMHLHDQSQKIIHFGNNVLCFNFIYPLQNLCLFYQSPAKVVHILKITYKEIMHIRYQLGKLNKFYQLGVKLAWMPQSVINYHAFW